MIRAIAVVLVIVGGGAGFTAWRHSVDEDARRQAAVESSQVRSWARANTAAGMSVLPKRVPAADRSDLRRLERLPGFHEYAMRCSSCHVLPDPGAYDARRWTGKVDEMKAHTGRSGIMPPPESDMEAALRFLRAASDTMRGTGGR